MSDQQQIVKRDPDDDPALSVTVRLKPMVWLVGSGTAVSVVGALVWQGQAAMAGMFMLVFALLGVVLSGKRLR